MLLRFGWDGKTVPDPATVVNGAQVFALLALANLFLARRKLALA